MKPCFTRLHISRYSLGRRTPDHQDVQVHFGFTSGVVHAADIRFFVGCVVIPLRRSGRDRKQSG
jgi:hypothetical protein